jgi:hypothetical protein
MIKEFLSRWPVIRQIRNHSDGTGPDAMTERTRQLRPRTGRRRGRAFGVSLLWRRLRATCLSQEREADLHRRRSRFTRLTRASLPQGCRYVRAPHPSRAPEESEISPALFATLGRTRSGDCVGHGGRTVHRRSAAISRLSPNGVLPQIAR